MFQHETQNNQGIPFEWMGGNSVTCSLGPNGDLAARGFAANLGDCRELQCPSLGAGLTCQSFNEWPIFAPTLES